MAKSRANHYGTTWLPRSRRQGTPNNRLSQPLARIASVILSHLCQQPLAQLDQSLPLFLRADDRCIARSLSASSRPCCRGWVNARSKMTVNAEAGPRARPIKRSFSEQISVTS